MRPAAVVSRCVLLAALATAACHSSTGPKSGPVTVDGTWNARDSLQRIMSLTLTQRGDSVHGSGTVNGEAVTVFGINLWPYLCSGGRCLQPPELQFALVSAASDTLFMAGFFGADSDHVTITEFGEVPLSPGFPFAIDTLTLVRVHH